MEIFDECKARKNVKLFVLSGASPSSRKDQHGLYQKLFPMDEPLKGTFCLYSLPRGVLPIEIISLWSWKKPFGVVNIQPAVHLAASVGWSGSGSPSWFTNVNEAFTFRRRNKDRLFSYL